MARNKGKQANSGFAEAGFRIAPDPGDELGTSQRADRIALAVKRAGSVAGVASAIGASDSTVQRYMAGESAGGGHFDKIAALARVCGVSLDWIAWGDDGKPPARMELPAQSLAPDEAEPELASLSAALQVVEELGGDPTPDARIRAAITADRRMRETSSQPPPPAWDARRLGRCLSFAEQLLEPHGGPRAPARSRLRLALGIYRLAAGAAIEEKAEKPASEADESP